MTFQKYFEGGLWLLSGEHPLDQCLSSSLLLLLQVIQPVCSFVDPDPHRSSLILVGWIRIQIQIHVLKCWMLSFEGWRLILLFRNPSRRPRDNKFLCLILKIRFFGLFNLKKISSLKPRDLDSDPALSVSADPDPYWNQCGSTTLSVFVYFIYLWFTVVASE